MKLYNFELWNKLKFILKIEYYKKDRIAGIFTDFFFGRNWKIQTNSKPESTWSVLSTTIKDRNPGVLSVLITTKKNCQNTFFKKPWESSFQSKFPNNSKKIPKEAPKKSQTIPKEYPQNPPKFPKIPKKLLTKYLEIFCSRL